jgi:hypothetical protein
MLEMTLATLPRLLAEVALLEISRIDPKDALFLLLAASRPLIVCITVILVCFCKLPQPHRHCVSLH